MMSSRAPLCRRWITCSAAAFVALLAMTTSALAREGSLTDALTRELGLTRAATEVRRAIVALERERESLRYTSEVLDHAGSESMRRWSAFGAVEGEYAVDARRRARMLYKMAHGGVARLVFESDRRTRRDRVVAGRLLRRVAAREYRELHVYRGSRERATAELVAAFRELEAVDAASQMHPMRAHVSKVAARELASKLAEAKPAAGRAGAGSVGAVAELRDELDRARRELAEASRSADRLVRPVPGRVVGVFGSYVDPQTQLPMQRDGIELSAAPRAEVRSMAGGRVVLVDAMPGYAQVVAIDHGDGRFSLTGRLWQVGVVEGQVVERGEVIGRVAPQSAQGGEGSTVYVELRHYERPVDPAPLLSRP
jgi:murein hydrolase activator